jgi:hypothetical protein
MAREAFSHHCNLCNITVAVNGDWIKNANTCFGVNLLREERTMT